MLSLNNFHSSKINLIYLFISIFILSFFFEHYFKLEFEFLRFSIVEVIFVTILFLTLLNYKLKFIRFIFKFDKKNIFEIIIYSILILKIIKLLLNVQNHYNLYELLIWMYMIGIYIIFKFYLNIYSKLTYHIENSFIVISLLISIHIIYSFLLYKFGYDSNNLWTIRDTTYYPYVGTSSVNFKSIFMNYNQPAHLAAPGFLFLLNRYKNNLLIIPLIIFCFSIFYLIKSKFLIVFFGILTVYLSIIYFRFQKIKLIKIFFIWSILGLSFFYFIATHFIIIEKGMINSSNFDLFKEYYFTDFVISQNNYDIYGSLFFKLKYTAVQIANTYNFVLFESQNYYHHPIVFEHFDNYTDPHSDYFGALANYGILGFLILLGFPIYIIYEYFINFSNNKLSKNSLIYFLIILMIFIEAMVVDFLHVQFVWIVFAIYTYNISSEKIKN